MTATKGRAAVGYQHPAVPWNGLTPPAARDLGHAVAEFLLAVAA